MIVYAATHPYSVTMGKFLLNWGRRLRRPVRLVYDEDLPRMARLPRGAWIFSDLERLGPAALVWALPGPARGILRRLGLG